MRILVLDDSLSRLRLFREKLIGTEFALTSTVDEVIEKLKEEDPWDYVFLDHDLGGLINQPSGPGTGYEVAQWLYNNPEKQPKNIIIHSFNEPGRKNIKALLPQAIEAPGAWTSIKISS